MAGLSVMAAQHGWVGHHHPSAHEPAPPGRAGLVAIGTSRSTRSGQSSTKAMAIRPPSEIPARCAGEVQPVHQARDVGGHLLDRVRPGGLAERPVPRLSTAITRASLPRTGQHAHLRQIQAEAAQQHQRGTRPVRLVIQLDVIHGDRGHPGILLTPRQHSKRGSLLCHAAAPRRGPRRPAQSGRPLSAGWLALRYWPAVGLVGMSQVLSRALGTAPR
jgi:hypothetical protein